MSEVVEEMVPEETSPMPNPDWPGTLIPGYELSSYIRGCNSTSIGEILTLLEATLPAGRQLDALKEVVKHEMWRLANIVQDAVYRYVDDLGVEEIKKLEVASEELKKKQYGPPMHEGTAALK